MIVECEKCNTRYRIADEKISDKGTKVRCTKCGHVFLIKKEKSPQTEKKSGKIGKKVLVVFILLIFIVAGYFGSKYILSIKEKKNVKVKDVVLEDVKQYFVENEKIGKLLVIEGKAVNKSKVSKRLIKIRATLYDKKGRVVSRKTLFAGNTLSLYQLQLFSQKEIDDALNSKIGILTKNSNVLPGQSVPFMVVFYNPPDRTSEFTLQITQALTIKTPIKAVK